MRHDASTVLYEEPLLHSPINFASVESSAFKIVETIRAEYSKLIDILLRYESFEVASDEIDRAIDLLSNLHENENYFRIRTGPVTSFLPRNQPLYALTCFVIVPALMSTEVHFRIPKAAGAIFDELLMLINFHELVPNARVSKLERLEFLRERSAIKRDRRTGRSEPVTAVVIFTGTSKHAEQLRRVFDKRTLFIVNGAGHNPVVVGEGANVLDAADAVVKVSLYNQGQDCAAPNAILVIAEHFDEFILELRRKLSQIRVGKYVDRDCSVGPISDPNDIPRIQSKLIEYQRFIDPATPGLIRSADGIVEPTLIIRPLLEGANFDENFSPLIFVQKYESDAQLSCYFEASKYAENAMYVTLFGESDYVLGLADRPVNGKVLHSRESIIRDTHLHAPGVERGTQPYGGRGPGASSISIFGTVVPKATLPQRDIYEYIALPVLEQNLGTFPEQSDKLYDSIEPRNLEKILGLRSHSERDAPRSGSVYVDLTTVGEPGRYLYVPNCVSFTLLPERNVDFISDLSIEDFAMIDRLRFLVSNKGDHSLESFTSSIYAIAKQDELSKRENRDRQLAFFKVIYRLLFGADSGPNLGSFFWERDVAEFEALLNF